MPRARAVVATRNPHKLRELGEILDSLELAPLPAEVELPPEDGDTFADNALAKARAAYEATGLAAIADDSGIEARALGGAPGGALGALRGREPPTRRTWTCCCASSRARPTARWPTSACWPTWTQSGAERLFEGRC